MKAVIPLSVACLVWSACTAVNQPSGAEISEARQAGLADLPRAVKDQANAAVFLLAATCVEVDWTPMVTRKPNWAAMLRTALSKIDPKKSSFGLAFAIDSRGYLLTAAHCVENRRYIYICGRVDGAPTVLQAALVHASKSSEPGGEYALLRVERPLPNVFPLGSLPKASDRLIAVSQLVEPVGANFVAGRLVSCDSTRDNPEIKIVETTIPLWNGDSGGPLLDRDGSVVGVNTGGYAGFHFGGKVFVRGHWHGQGISTYPDPGRIRMLILHDLNDRVPNQPALSHQDGTR